jgi:tetratricopeptide (TPR) repeat protein
VPFTLNGIGTHYYGAKNRSARIDVCKSCKRSATLSSYDTREWFCVVFIPLIPLTKYRILDDCSSCRRHHRLKAAAFAEQVTAAVAPLREVVRKAPGDPQGYLDLTHALVSWEMRDEAQRELEAAVTKFPNDAAIHVLAGQLLVDRGEWQRALPFFERAHSLDSQNAAAVYGHGWLLHQLGRDEEAIGVLQRANALSEHRGALLLTGMSQSRLARWSEALQTYQRLLGMEPAYANDKTFLQRIAECKRNLGYELSDAERRASRRWWPFGKSKTRKQPKLAGSPTLVRPSLRVAGLILLAVMLFGGTYVAWDRYTNIAFYVDNGLGRAVQVQLDGKGIDVGARAHQKESLGNGAHTIVIREAGGQKEIERLAFEIPSASIFDAVMHDRFFVYNVSAANIYRRSTHGYAARAEDSTYGEELVAVRRFFEQRDVDYPFAQPPKEISMDANARSVKKIAFNVADDIPLVGYAVVQLQQGQVDTARLAMRQAIANAPCDTNTRHMQLYFVAATAGREMAATTARQWIADCASDDLEAHRAYQTMELERGRHDAVLAEYRKRLDAAPQSAEAHYLVGRITSDPAMAIAEYTQAVQLDPKFVWPHTALGFAYHDEERYDDAMRELAAALDMEGHASVVSERYAMAAIAKGSPADAIAKIEQVHAAAPQDVVTTHARWLLALAGGEWEKAEALQKELATSESPGDAWWRRLKLLRLKSDDAAADLQIESAAANEELRPLRHRALILRALEKRDYRAARLALKEGADVVGPTDLSVFQGYIAAGLMLSGDAAGAKELLAEAEKALAANPESAAHHLSTALIAGLDGSLPVERVMTISREAGMLQHGWFVAGVRAAAANDRKRAADCFARAMRVSSDLEFPYLEIRTMAELVR